MSNRTDWRELAEEVMDIYSLANRWPDGLAGPLQERLETEMHNAFVAGQEDHDRYTKCPDAVKKEMEEIIGAQQQVIDELQKELEDWSCLAGNPISLQSFINEVADLRAFKKEWDSEDGNSPGYNLQKARNYGKQAAIFKKLYLSWRSASMTLKALTSVSIHGVGNKAFAAARKLEKESVNEWPEIFPEQVVKDPVNKMDAIEEANKRAQEEMKPGPTPFHDRYHGKRVGDLTTEQLEEEVARRKGEGPFQKMFVMVRVIGTLSNGVKKDFLHWEYQDIDPESFTAQHNAEFLDLKVKRIKG
jgi:hypothetical protein